MHAYMQPSIDPVYILELNAMLMDIALETHAWSSARPVYETESAGKNIERRLEEVIKREEEQGMFQPSPHVLPFCLSAWTSHFCCDFTHYLSFLLSHPRANTPTPQSVRLEHANSFGSPHWFFLLVTCLDPRRLLLAFAHLAVPCIISRAACHVTRTRTIV